MGLEPIFSEKEIRKILERGLVTGKWSIVEFNKRSINPVLPSREFLEANPQFLDPTFRDLETFKSMGHYGIQ
jgi:hypothetical protein